MADSSSTLPIHPLLQPPSAHWRAVVRLYRAVTLGGLLLAMLPLALDGPQPVAGPAGFISLLVIAALLLQAPLLVINVFRRRLLRQVSAVIATVPGHPVQLRTETTARELVVRLTEHRDDESRESIRIRCDQVVGDTVPPINTTVAAMQHRVDPETSATPGPARFAIVWDRGVLWGQAPDAARDRRNMWLGVAVVVLVLESILAVTAAAYWNDYRTLSAEWQRAEATRAWPVTEGWLSSSRLDETRVSVGRGWVSGAAGAQPGRQRSITATVSPISFMAATSSARACARTATRQRSNNGLKHIQCSDRRVARWLFITIRKPPAMPSWKREQTQRSPPSLATRLLVSGSVSFSACWC